MSDDRKPPLPARVPVGLFVIEIAGFSIYVAPLPGWVRGTGEIVFFATMAIWFTLAFQGRFRKNAPQ